MYAFHGQAHHAFGHGFLAREQTRADGVGVQLEQFARVVGAIPDEDLVLIARMRGQRPDDAQAAPFGREHAGHVQEGLALAGGQVHAHFAGDLVLLVQGQAEFEQLRLLLLDQSRQRDGGAHVGQRIVRRFVDEAIGLAQVFQFKAGLAIVALRPLNAFRAQRVRHAHHVEDVPAAAMVLPFARIRIDQVAPEQETRDFIVETDGVVACADGARFRKGRFDGGGELVLGHAQLQTLLRRDARDQARLRVGQEIIGRLAIQHDRFADLVEVGIRADGGELGRAVAARLGAKGFVVVPKKSLGSH